MNADEAMVKFDFLLEKVHPDALSSFLHRAQERIKEELSEEEGDEDEDHNKDVILDNIRETLRDSLPVSAITSTETILHPTVGPNSKMNKKHTVHVDAFLYDDELLDELCDSGKLSRNYCTSCGCQDVRPLTLITHSASVPQLKYLFRYVLPSLQDKTLLDIGSRTGAVLYGAYLYSKCRQIVGVELDTTFCKLQEQIITDYEMGDRIAVHHQDILDNLSLVSSSDVVIMNNVFEFFLTKELQERMWRALSEALKKPGIIVITVPSIEESLENLGILKDVHMDWLKPVDLRKEREKARHALFGGDTDNDELDNIFMYTT
ncbi:uncharacterized protein LOC143281619 [Babylonia areolata]|uniref:uncharacterized protein LOC143281619 n=1 Tax=Babylonia areolata TaxID=304850 RepID=UPI003FD509DC